MRNTAGYPDGYPALNNIHYEEKKPITTGHVHHPVIHYFLTDFQELGGY
jgi:hypothetical protein